MTTRTYEARRASWTEQGSPNAAVRTIAARVHLGRVVEQDDVVHHDSDAPAILKIGTQAPDFRLPGVDGQTHSLKDYASSKVLVVIFSCDHCPVAEMYEKRIKQLAADYKNRGVAVVVIMGNDPKAEELSEYGYTDVGDSFADMKARAAYRHFTYPYLYDGATQAVALKHFNVEIGL